MEMNISKMLNLLLARLKYIVLVALIFAIATFGYTKMFVSEQYTSTAKFLVTMDETNSKSTEANFVKEAIHSYLAIYETEKFFKEAAEIYNAEYNTEYTASNLRAMTSISPASNEDQPYFTIRITASNPDLAFNLANTISDYAKVKADEYKALNEISLIDDPLKPIVPSSPNVTKNTFMGLIVGAFLASAAFVLKELMDKKIKNLEDITSIYDIPILGVVPDTSPETKGGRGKEDKED
ncbi:MAG: hypothetical protein E7613_01995 [Ruminococcaceae bacterium]|nr:hypothetical protein [Oscillospiraceae bacterium]